MGKIYKIKYRKKSLDVNSKILKDTINLLGKDVLCYIYKEEELIYLCNNNG